MEEAYSVQRHAAAVIAPEPPPVQATPAARWRYPLVLQTVLIADGIALALSMAVTVGVCVLLGWGHHIATLPWPVGPVSLGLFLLGYALLGLYPGIPVYEGSPVGYTEEIRRLTRGTSLVSIIILAALLLTQGIERSLVWVGTWLVMWIAAIPLVPIARSLSRGLLARWTQWGYPVVVFGAGRTGRVVIGILQRNPELGLRPVAVLDDHIEGSVLGVPVVGKLDAAHRLAVEGQVPFAIWAIPGVLLRHHGSSLDSIGRFFHRWLVITPPEFAHLPHWRSAEDPDAPDLQRQSRHVFARWLKRATDLTLTSALAIVALPLMAVIAVLIKLDSPGPVLFRQHRPGKGRRSFTIYKFRTMHAQATHLVEHHRHEFEHHGKVRDDPRITRLGRWLRRTSLDELPQLFNVLKGDMSLIGPRAYLEEQLDQIDDHSQVIFDVLPGITGLWQVSGRSNTTFEERLALDALYVRNWSIWLDAGILIRTLFTVLGGRGAY